jgi:dCMP deaminase
MSTSKWPARFLQLAQLVASWSKDPSTQVGAVATNSTNHILETGYNGPPRGVEDLEARFQRPAKYLWTTHAEANLVAAAAASRLQGSTVYVTHLCCAQCAALLINSKVTKVVCGPGLTSMAPEQFDVALRMFEEAGVELVVAEPEAGCVGSVDKLESM